MNGNEIPEFGEEVIYVGDKVDLVSQSGSVYRTMIEDRHESGPFLAGVPIRKGVYMHAEQGDDIFLVFYRETGRYIAQMKVIALEKRGEVRYMWLLQKTAAQKNQRREAFRLPVSFDVQIFEYMEDIETSFAGVVDEVKAIALEAVSSRDISVTGIALLTKKAYRLEDMYLLNMHLDLPAGNIRSGLTAENEPALHVTASVKRSIPWRTGKAFNTGMQFLGMTERMSETIARFVLTEQQRQIKKRRLIQM